MSYGTHPPVIHMMIPDWILWTIGVTCSLAVTAVFVFLSVTAHSP